MKIRYVLVALAMLLNSAHAQVLPAAIGIVSINGQPVMVPSPGTGWDSVDVANPSIFTWQGQLVNYYSGYDGAVWRTGLAVSGDGGNTWATSNNGVSYGPLLAPGTGGWATQYIAANGATIVLDNTVYYYYQGVDANGRTQIGLATAPTAHMLALTVRNAPVIGLGAYGSYDDWGVADPYVIKVRDQLWMYYLAYDHNYKFTIARAVSTDGVTWVKDGAPELGSGSGTDYDSTGGGEPCVFYSQGYWYMIYTGNTPSSHRSLLWAWSTDGQHWTKAGLIMPESYRPAWASQVLADPTVIPSGNDDGNFTLWFLGGDVATNAENMHGVIGKMVIHVTGNGP